MRVYLMIKNFLRNRSLEGFLTRFLGIFIIDFFMIKTIASKSFINFLVSLEYHFSLSLERKELMLFYDLFAGSSRIYIMIISLALFLWLFKQKKILKKYFYIYLIWLNFKFVLAILFLIVGLWNPTANALNYLVTGCLTWLINVLIFANYYWLIDQENQKMFLQDKTAEINFLFSPTSSGLSRYQNWLPTFFDYLFLAFNTSISFSQSNAEYLTKKGRILTMIQSAIALVINVIIIARAVSLIGTKPNL